MATAATALPVTVPDSQKWILRWLPALTDLAFLLPLGLLVWMFPEGLSALLGDGDTGWHIRTGEWILQHHAIPHKDLFSFTRAGDAWFAWEWGWDVLFAYIHSLWGLAGVALVNAALLCFISAALFHSAREMSGNDLIAFAITVLGMGATAIHWLARPHLLSWLFFLVLLLVLRKAERGQTALLWVLPALELLWTNVHGSFFLGVFMLALTGFAQLLPGSTDGGAEWRGRWNRSQPFWACALLCSALTFVNPYTWHVHAHILTYLGDSSLLDRIQEFQSTSFHHGPSVIFGWLLLPGGAAIFWCFQRKNWSGALALVAWMHLALLSARNVPLFVFVACPIISAMLADVFANETNEAAPRVKNVLRAAHKSLFPFERVPRFHAVSIAVLLFVALSVAGAESSRKPNFPAKSFPVAAIPVIERANAKRILATDQWSDYLVYRLYPSARIFVDGRSDFFGNAFLDKCQNILEARWDWEADLERYLVDMVVVTPQTPIATVLKRSDRWKAVLDDGTVIVFERLKPAESSRSNEHTQVSAVGETDGRRGLEADSAFKYRTHNHERRCV